MRKRIKINVLSRGKRAGAPPKSKRQSRGHSPALIISGASEALPPRYSASRSVCGDNDVIDDCNVNDSWYVGDKMAKDPAHMTHPERMAALMRDLSSSNAVFKADKMLELIGHEYLDVLSVRDMAARRHGATTAPPPMPGTPTPPVVTTVVEPEPPAEPKAALTVSGLADIYMESERFAGLRHATKANYVSLTKRLREDCGDTKLEDLKLDEINTLYAGWSRDNKVAMGHAVISMLRTLVSYGATTFEDPNCLRLSALLRTLRFEITKPRTVVLTAEYATAIREKAHKMRLPSLALAQALQFDCRLRQKDVIGEWIPQSEPGVSDVVEGNDKWMRGVRWSQIDDDLILRHALSKDDEEIVIDLKDAPMVMAELERFKERPRTGPMIVSEDTKLPYRSYEFRRSWREAADAAGVPREVKNMDTRAGATNENSEEKYRRMHRRR